MPRFAAPPAVLWAASLCAALAMAPGAALGYSISLSSDTTGEVVRWPKSNIPYWLHPACSSDLNTAACLSECHESFKTWVGKGCSTLQMYSGGQSSNKKLTSIGYNKNGMNEVAWIENSAWTYGKYVLGVTSPYYYTSGPEKGDIIEADIAMNGYLQTWSVSGKSYSTDVRNVLVHEVGHFFGLQHNLYPSVANPETMAPQADPFMKTRTPEADDVNGLCFLYPKTGTTQCASDKDCPYVVIDTPSGEQYGGVIPCKSSTCGGQTAAVPKGGKKLGETCASSADCDAPTYCQPLSGSQAVCSQDCVPAQKNCPQGFYCAPFQSDSSKGACLKDVGGPSATKNIGETCQSSDECKSQLCVIESGGQFCRQPCTSNAQCPTGQTCSLFSGKTYGGCFPDQGTTQPPAKKEVGDTCQSSTECKSDLCVGSGAVGTCIQACSGTQACPAGMACMKLSSGAGGCFKAGDKKIGETCAASSDCAGGICAASDGKYVCSQSCGAGAPCPSGYTCYPLSGGGGGCFKSPQKKGDGQTCDYSSECQSGLCVGAAVGKCVQPCNPDKSQCGPGFLCVPLTGGGGACLALGNGKMGDKCDKPSDCATGTCVGLGSAGYVCTAQCAGTAECDCGYECVTFSGGASYCEPGKKVACVDDGQSCTGDGQCVSGVCLAGKCATTCSIYSGAQHCGGTLGCMALVAGSPEGVCTAKGASGFGGPCKANGECKSLFCHGGTCSIPCSPFLPNTCTMSLVCKPASGDVGHCGFPDPVGQDAGTGGSDAGGAGGSDAGGRGAADAGSAPLDAGPVDVSDAGNLGQLDAGGTGNGTVGIMTPPTTGPDNALCSGSPVAPAHRGGWLVALVLALLWRRRQGAAVQQR